MVAFLFATCGSKPGAISLEVQNMDIVRLSFYAYNEGDWSSFAELHSPLYLQHAPDYKDPIPLGAYELSCRTARKRFPDLKYRIEDIFAFEDKVSVRLSWQCSSDSMAFKECFPDGVGSGSMISIVRIRNGKIIEEWCEYDTVGIQRLVRSVKFMEHI
ncbi:hypothetical protein ES705_45428 [subsurface metagenome]